MAFCSSKVLGGSTNPIGQIAINKGGIEMYRFGGGMGYGFYLTNQMDYQITTNYGSFNELIPSYLLGFHKALNSDFEIGVEARNGHLLTLKSENTQGSTCDFNDAYFMVDYSLNHNADLSNQRFTINAQMGLGLTYFRSKYFTVNTKTKEIDKIWATLGYNGELTSIKDQANKQAAIIGSIGFNFGYRLSNTINIYWETTTNISTSNKMSGNLFKRSWIPPDSYFMSSLGIYFRLGSRKGQLGCPKF
ncbi:MAG: hypothetical protein CFE21_12030 [Bacteroidetes bacterium B1(2017)]|nr:MAG: hypothetical protein CFE21_12030 [Bacteroidetes bacterium B1(2017)]